MPHLRWSTAGESHGPSLLALLDGVPAGLALLAEHIDRDLARRQRGYGRGGRMKIERDAVAIEAGVRGAETLGSPIALRIINRDFANWQGRMGPEPFAATPEPVSTPRPGHADLPGALKYDRADLRDVLERASARETAARVAAGAVARRVLEECGVAVRSRVLSIGPVRDGAEADPRAWVPGGALADRVEASSLRVLDEGAEEAMRAEILAAAHAGDTLGGVVEVVALGVVPGLGSYAQWDRRLDGRLAQAAMSVQAIKAVEIGEGWSAAAARGSAVHDAIVYVDGAYARASNRAGGLEGGVSNGEPLVLRAAMKPISTLRRALASVDVRTHEAAPANTERSDVCAVPAAGVVLEAMVCLTLADALLEKLGGDSMRELLRNLDGYRDQLAGR
ncbi:MAG: chorismate synthase [Deltaproteobacteria bacterium]|nr:chorismate synthase [Myxococcales bacterium]MDP3212511.1 chorismate synthase [Deltaproteobacteria bacterium]